MSRNAAGSSPHHRMMMREMTGNRAGDSATDAALRLGRRGDGKAGGKSDDQGNMNGTHESLPEVIDGTATWLGAGGSD
jgi:hypothetical protein